MRSALVGLLLGLCACAALRAVDEVNDPTVDADLARCRAEARKARAADASPEYAYAAYYDCTREAGLR